MPAAARNHCTHRPIPQDCRGFTLLELMVVIVIIALMFSFTTLSFRSDTPEDALRKEAYRFDKLLGLLQEEAILRGEDFGIEFTPASYQFLRYDGKSWAPIENDEIFRLREMPLDIELELSIEQTDIVLDAGDDDSGHTPQVFVLSSNEITPEFNINFFIPTITMQYFVKARFDGFHEVVTEL